MTQLYFELIAYAYVDRLADGHMLNSDSDVDYSTQARTCRTTGTRGYGKKL